MTTAIPDSFTECYVAFVDILGVRALVKRSQSEADLYQNIVSALVEAKNLSVFRRDRRDIDTGNVASWALQVQAFSDCVVLFIPVESGMLSWLLASVRRLHDRMIGLGVCLRGAVTIGGMHWDSQWSAQSSVEAHAEDAIGSESTPVAFGPGLVAAYELEDGCAVYPRFLIAGDLYDHIESLGLGRDGAFPLARDGRLLDFIRQDFDGLWHFDVLHRDINRRDVLSQVKETNEQGNAVVRNEFDETSYEDRLIELRRFITRNIETCAKEPILAKYQWLARYFNEKSRPVGVKAIPIFKDELPEGVPQLKITWPRDPT